MHSRVHDAPAKTQQVGLRHDAPASSQTAASKAAAGVQPAASQPAASSRGRAPAHIAPQMVGRPQARASFLHAPGSSPSRTGSQPATARPARNAAADGDSAEAAAEAAADAGEAVETTKQAQQRRLMSLQVGFWVVVLGLFFGFVVCRGRRRRKGARPRADLMRSY